MQGYPTIRILRDRGARSHNYAGPRDAAGIVAYLKRQAGPASVEIAASASPPAADSIANDGVVVVSLTSSSLCIRCLCLYLQAKGSHWMA